LGLPGFPNTEHAWEKAVSIPIYPALERDETSFIIDTIRGIF